MQNTASARIDLTALRDNLGIVRSLCPASRVMAMIKADAYGHGLLPVARALEAADGFAVARLDEALQLRDAGIRQRVLLLGTLLDETELATCSARRIDVTAHDQDTVTSIAAVARRAPLRVWLKLDSGMHRLGLDPAAFAAANRTLSVHSGIAELVHMTHFSSAGEPGSAATDQQWARFVAAHQDYPQAAISAANSAALISRPETRGDWVRPGIMLYGDDPLGGHQLALRPAMTLRARVIAVRTIPAGESVGYNQRWTSTRPSRIATVGIGYGDGYPRHARGGTPVLLNGSLVPLVGQVSMDLLAVDVSDCGPVVPGDEAILWGAELPAATIAECANTITYELFTSLSQRADREYVG